MTKQREERAAEAHVRVARCIVMHIEGECERVTARIGPSRRPYYTAIGRERALADAEAWWLRLTEAEREAHPETAAMLNAAVRDLAGGE